MKTKLNPAATLAHATGREMYDAYGWHLDTEHLGGVVLQTVGYDWLDKPDEEVVERLIHDHPELHRSEAQELVAQAREILCVMNTIEMYLAAAVRGYKAGKVDQVVKALESASMFEKEHGDDPATRALRSQLLLEVDDDSNEDEGMSLLPTDDEVARLIRERCYKGCPESDHIAADNLLVEMLGKLGYPKTVEAFNGIRKWYA